jgi:Metal-dependent hydrolases of the beta-lactamase superfamily I
MPIRPKPYDMPMQGAPLPTVDGENDRTLRVRFWGTRGSLPVSGAAYRRFGGNTPCVEMSCGGRTLLFDAGTGIRPAGVAALHAGQRDFHLFFTHFHYDHVMGLPFFAPLYDPSFKLEVWSGLETLTTQEMLRGLMRAPWFPVEISICRAALISRDFRPTTTIEPYPDVKVKTGLLNHPGGCVGYRVEYEGRAVALISDTEHVEGTLDENVLALIDNADLVIYDAAYTDEEMAFRRGFGHSTWQQGVRLCQAAGAKRLALFHHDPYRGDGPLAAIETRLKETFAGGFAARDGQAVSFAARRAAARKI